MTRHSCVWLAACVTLVSLTACGSSGGKVGNSACKNGICGTAAGSGGSSGNGSGGNGSGGNGSGGNGSGGNGSGGNGSGGNGSGGNGSGGNGSGGNGGGGNGGSGGSGGPTCATGANCQESWLCSPWKTATSATGGVPTADNAGTRTCVDQCNCGTTKSKPAESETLPALDFNYYQCQVEPILDKFCAQLGCHGTESGRALRVYARAKLRITGETWNFTGCLATNKQVKSEDCIGNDECECWVLPHSNNEWQRNFDAARAFALDAQGQALGNIEDSDLLAKPLGTHGGLDSVFSKTSSQYTTIKSWLDKTGTGCTNTAQKTN